MLSLPVRPPGLGAIASCVTPRRSPVPGPFAPVVDDRGHFETEGNP